MDNPVKRIIQTREVATLQAYVAAAYREGWQRGYNEGTEPGWLTTRLDRDWLQSKARARLVNQGYMDA